MRYIVIFKRQYLGSDLADMQLITKLNKSFFFFLLCVFDIYNNYA